MVNWKNKRFSTSFSKDCIIFFIFLVLRVPCAIWDLSSQTKDWTPAPWVEGWSLNHWTVWEGPRLHSSLWKDIFTSLYFGVHSLFFFWGGGVIYFLLKDNCFTKFYCFLSKKKQNGTLHEFACHPCAGAMLISVFFQL